MWIAARILLGIAALGWSLLAGFVANLLDGFGVRGPSVLLLAISAFLGLAAIVGLSFRRPWGALFVMAQVVGIFSSRLLMPRPHFWLTVAMIATLLLAITVAWRGSLTSRPDPGVG